MKPNSLPPGPHPGFARLRSQPGIFRARLRPETDKRKPEDADYSGLLQLAGDRKAGLLLWCHQDGSLGLRVELIPEKAPKNIEAASG